MAGDLAWVSSGFNPQSTSFRGRPPPAVGGASFLPEVQTMETTQAADCRLTAVLGLAVIGAVSVSFVNQRARKHGKASSLRPCLRHVACRAEGEASSESEAEQIFREAYELEAERATLLASQLEAALAQKLGIEGSDGVTIAVQAPAALSPLQDPSTTWRKAYEAIKVRTSSLESQLKKAKGLGAPPAPAPSATATQADETATSELIQEAETFQAKNVQSTQDFGRGSMEDPMAQVQRLREVAAAAKEEDAVLRLIAAATLPNPNREPLLLEEGQEPPGDLPRLQKAQEVLTREDFSVSSAITFERCYIFSGAVPSGRDPEAALQSMQQRMQSLGVSGAAETELYLQPAKEEGKSLVIMLHRADLPSSDVPLWQWALFAFLIAFSFFASNSTTFAVVPINQQVMQDVDALARVLEKCLPTAFGIMSTVGAQELVRRLIGAQYGVELTPPFLLPTWPIASAGCLGAVSRRLSPAPNRQAEFNMSAGAAITGFVVSIGLIIAGLSMGAEPDGVVNLNYQLLPVILKVILRPFLGNSPLTNQADPFSDPLALAFPANPVLVGGVVGLVITSLSLLPIGRLDGGVLARSALGDAASPLGLLSFVLLVAGSFAPDDAGSLYLTFGISALVWQSGSELPPKEAINDISGFQKAIAFVLLGAGFLLSIPGWGFPQI